MTDTNTPRTSDNSKVICPACCHEFAAISVDDQAKLAAANASNERLTQQLLRLAKLLPAKNGAYGIEEVAPALWADAAHLFAFLLGLARRMATGDADAASEFKRHFGE